MKKEYIKHKIKFWKKKLHFLNITRTHKTNDKLVEANKRIEKIVKQLPGYYRLKVCTIVKNQKPAKNKEEHIFAISQ